MDSVNVKQDAAGAHAEDGDEDNNKEPLCKVQKMDALFCEEPGSSICCDMNLNTALIAPGFVDFLKKHWTNRSNFSDENITINCDPFQLCVIQNLLSETNAIKEIVKEMVSINWTRTQMDLYEFYQSTDLCNASSPYLKKFYKILKEHVMPWMEDISGLKFSHLSASCSMYNCGDYLLVHDDLFTNRQIAFVFYISPWDNVKIWTSDMGGCLEIFETDANDFPCFPAKNKISPKNNQFVFFKVENKSFHQVGEVTSYDYPRLTINGWFHSVDNNSAVANSAPVSTVNLYKTPGDCKATLEEFINNMYLNDKSKKSIQEYIEETSEMSLDEFFKPKIFEELSSSLKLDKDLKWTIKGPANAHYYEVLEINNVNGLILDFVDLLSSHLMFELLHEFTELDLLTCFVEIQRWSRGCYTVLGDNSQCSESSLDLILYVNAFDGVGIINYLLPEPEENEIGEDYDDSVLLTITPRNNALNIVYRSAGTTKFTKYVSKKNAIPHNEYVYMIVCSYKE